MFSVKQKYRGFLLAVIPFLAFVMIIWITAKFKMGVAPDSINYMSMSKHIAAGKGVSTYNPSAGHSSIHMSSYAPLYAFILAFFNLLTVELDFSTWILNSLLFGINLYLVGYLIYHFTQRLIYGIFAELILFFDTEWRSFHCWILAEPLFFCLGTLTVICIWKYLMTKKIKWLIWTALTTGLLSLTRYIGFSYIIAGVFCLLWGLRDRWEVKIKYSFLLGILSSVPLALWVIRNVLVSHQIFGVFSDTSFHPQLDFYDLVVNNIQTVIRDTLSYPIHSWILPIQSQPYVIVVILCLLSISFLTISRYKEFLNSEKKDDFRLLNLLWSYTVSYLVCLIVCLIGCQSKSNPEPTRYLAPAYTHLWSLFVLYIYIIETRKSVWRRFQKTFRFVHWVGCLLLFIGAGHLVILTYDWVWDTTHYGVDGSSGGRWRSTHSIQWFPQTTSDQYKKYQR